MKKVQIKYMKFIPITLSFSFLLLLTTGCYQYPEIDETLYEGYRRVIGPEGGTINFYRNYENDSLREIAVTMEFPQGALDTFIVFNMYEYYDYVLENDLYNMNRIAVTDFLYFVPFYESVGYVEHDSLDIDEHLSINFLKPVSITYYLDNFDIYPNSKLYRINIPGENEWGEGEDYNIWVNYNEQGYPDGYDEQDLMYLINGSWTENIEWGSDTLCFDNWEEINFNQYTLTNESVKFNIEETDYIYVLAVDMIK